MNRVSTQAKEVYARLLLDARSSESKEPIPNRYPWHCQLAVRELLSYAANRQTIAQRNNAQSHPIVIRILTGTLPEYIYGSESAEEFRSFLNAGGQVRVLAWTDAIEVESKRNRGSLLKWTSDYPGLIEFKISGTKTQGDSISHFLVVDQLAYRHEAPHPYFGDQKIDDLHPEVPARICFNDSMGAERLVKFFDALWDASQCVAIGDQK